MVRLDEADDDKNALPDDDEMETCECTRCGPEDAESFPKMPPQIEPDEWAMMTPHEHPSKSMAGPSRDAAPCAVEAEGIPVSDVRGELKGNKIPRAAAAAADGADPRGELIPLWLRESKGKGKPAVAWGSRLVDSITSWFHQWVSFVPSRNDREGWMFFELVDSGPVSGTKLAWHATNFYAARSIAARRTILSSNSRVPGSLTLGGVEGAYVTDDWATATNPDKAIPHLLFDSDYHQLIVEVLVAEGQALPLKRSSEPQEAYPSNSVVPIGFWVSRSCGMERGARRFEEWDPELEVPWGDQPVTAYGGTCVVHQVHRIICALAASSDSPQTPPPTPAPPSSHPSGPHDAPPRPPLCHRAATHPGPSAHNAPCGWVQELKCRLHAQQDAPSADCHRSVKSCRLKGSGPIMCIRAQGWFIAPSTRNATCPACCNPGQKIQDWTTGHCKHTRAPTSTPES